MCRAIRARKQCQEVYLGRRTEASSGASTMFVTISGNSAGGGSPHSISRDQEEKVTHHRAGSAGARGTAPPLEDICRNLEFAFGLFRAAIWAAFSRRSRQGRDGRRISGRREVIAGVQRRPVQSATWLRLCSVRIGCFRAGAFYLLPTEKTCGCALCLAQGRKPCMYARLLSDDGWDRGCGTAVCGRRWVAPGIALRLEERRQVLSVDRNGSA